MISGMANQPSKEIDGKKGAIEQAVAALGQNVNKKRSTRNFIISSYF